MRRHNRLQVAAFLAGVAAGVPAFAQEAPALRDIIAAASAQNHAFLFATSVEAEDARSGEDCVLASGDLARFNRIPESGSETSEMRVLTSRGGSCRAGRIVEIRLDDIQEMLIAFSRSAGYEARRNIPKSSSQPPARALQIEEPWQTVEIEHDDRRNRLVRLSNLKGIARPEFFEYRIEQSKHHLADYPTKIPVLRVVFRDRVFFDFDKDSIKPQALAVIETIAESLRKEASDVSVFVTGHTDAIGSAGYNLGLGLRRSRAVATGLLEKGIAKAQLFVVSFGKAVPIASNDTDEGRAENRRVEFLFAARPDPIAAWLVEQPYMQCKGEVAATADDCLGVFEAERVELKPKPKPVPLSNGATTLPPPAEDKTAVTFGSKSVTIDLATQSFSFPPPEGP